MITCTTALQRYRENSQAYLDFAVFVCHAAPHLKTALVGGAPSPTPEHFQSKPSQPAALLAFGAKYEEELARATLITVFSYFEMYVRSMLLEVIDFHGGADAFVKQAERRAKRFLVAPPPEVEGSRRKLQERAKPAWRDRYMKYSRVLDKAGYRFPTELVSPYGARALVKKSTEKTGLRAWEIPDLFEHALLFPLTKPQRDLVNEVRGKRNEVAHGASPTLALRYSLKTASDLHGLASEVDRHVVAHFLVLNQAMAALEMASAEVERQVAHPPIEAPASSLS